MPEQVAVREAWEKVIHQVHERLWAHCRRLTRDSNLADDLFQQTMLKVLRGGGFPRFEADPFTYLAVVAKNCWLTYLKRAHETVPLSPEYEPSASTVSSIDEIEQAEVSEWLNTCITKLPHSLRVVIIIRLNGASPSWKEVARALDRPVDTVKKQYRRAINLLRAEACVRSTSKQVGYISRHFTNG